MVLGRQQVGDRTFSRQSLFGISPGHRPGPEGAAKFWSLVFVYHWYVRTDIIFFIVAGSMLYAE